MFGTVRLNLNSLYELVRRSLSWSQERILFQRQIHFWLSQRAYLNALPSVDCFPSFSREHRLDHDDSLSHCLLLRRSLFLFSFFTRTLVPTCWLRTGTTPMQRQTRIRMCLAARWIIPIVSCHVCDFQVLVFGLWMLYVRVVTRWSSHESYLTAMCSCTTRQSYRLTAALLMIRTVLIN